MSFFLIILFIRIKDGRLYLFSISSSFYFIFIFFTFGLRLRVLPLLLSLVLLSWIVVPIRELANKHFLISVLTLKSQNIAKLPSGIDIDIDDTIRKRSTFLSRMTFRSIFIVSNISSYIYYLKIEYNNDLPNNIAVDSIDSSQLLYSGDVKAEGNLVSKKTFNPILTKKLQYVQYNNPTLNKALKSWGKDTSNNNTSSSSMQEDVINIQLPYNPNQPMNSDL